MKRILITENQFENVFLSEQYVPSANAGEIQKFLKDLGYYKGEVDWDFGDSTAEAFAKYYGGASLGWVKTLRQLYDELKAMRFPVGNTFGFGPKMAKVISGLIEKKESEKTKITPNALRNIGEWPYESVLKKLNVTQKQAEVCKPCTKPLNDEEIMEWWFSQNKETNAPIVNKAKKLWNPRETHSCIACHRFIGPFALTKEDDPEGWQNMVFLMNTTNHLDDAIQPYVDKMAEYLKPVGEFIVEFGQTFDCSGDLHKSYNSDGSIYKDDYWHCVLDNLSIGVSTVPYIGTVGSAVFDFVNAAYYAWDAGVESIKGTWDMAVLGDYESAYEHWERGAWYSMGVAFSALGIIPGVTEFRLLKRLDKVVINTGEEVMENLIKKAGKPENVKNLTKKEFEVALEKGIKGKNLTKKQIKDIGTYVDLLEGVGKNTAKKLDSQINKLQNLITKNGLSRKELIELGQSKEFQKLLKKNGGDIVKTLNNYVIKKSFKTLTYQMVLSTGFFALIKGIGYLMGDEVSEETKKRFKEEIDIVEESGVEQLGLLYKLFRVCEQCIGGDDCNSFYNSFWDDNVNLPNCKNRKAAIEAHKKGLRLKKPKEDSSYICDYLTTEHQWSIFESVLIDNKITLQGNQSDPNIIKMFVESIKDFCNEEN